MDSTPPPSSSRSRSLYRLRPWYLVAAMVLTWFAGVERLTRGFADAVALREGRLPDLAAAAQAVHGWADTAALIALGRAAMLNAMMAESGVTFPVSVAGAILGGLLVIASGLAMGGRPGARSLALQATLANAAFAVAAYVLTYRVRAAWIDTMVGAAGGPPLSLWWSGRFKLLAADLGPLVLGLWALTRPRARAFFNAAAHAAEDT